MLLKKLCETHAVSGDEARVRQIILDNIKSYADERRETRAAGQIFGFYGQDLAQ